MRKCLHLLPDSSSTDGPTLLVCEVNGVDHVLEILTYPLSLGQQICSVIITGEGVTQQKPSLGFGISKA